MKARKYLTQREVLSLIAAVSAGRTGARDSCLILLAFRHGYRISELLSLSFGDLDLDDGRIYIRRLKNGLSTIHPLMEDEVQALRGWKEERARWSRVPEQDAVFISVRGNRLSRKQAWRIIRHAGEKAGTATGTHPHMLRHACGYELAERGADTRLIQDYLGHRNIRHTVRYTASPDVSAAALTAAAGNGFTQYSANTNIGFTGCPSTTANIVTVASSTTGTQLAGNRSTATPASGTAAGIALVIYSKSSSGSNIALAPDGSTSNTTSVSASGVANVPIYVGVNMARVWNSSSPAVTAGTYSSSYTLTFTYS